jgi:hypothetical protein
MEAKNTMAKHIRGGGGGILKNYKNHCLKIFLIKTLKLVVEKENVKNSSSTPAQKKRFCE